MILDLIEELVMVREHVGEIERAQAQRKLVYVGKLRQYEVEVAHAVALPTRTRDKAHFDGELRGKQRRHTYTHSRVKRQKRANYFHE